MSKFEELKGQTLTSIIGGIDDPVMTFITTDNKRYKSYNQEQTYGNDVEVIIDDIVGDLSDIINSPILLAEEISDTSTEELCWTFYKLSTIKGSVTIKWYGRSNGYYSEEVDFELMYE